MKYNIKSKNKYLIQLTEKMYNKDSKSFFGGFDGDLAYDFVGKRYASCFNSKRKAKNQLKRLKKECTFDKEYQKLDIIKLKK